ncbi:MAG: hypothetical protein N4A54_04635 [Peptostreptococcaceae bacterium]|nr:hypothetical protein [Peptostreptococcaceae bacterium]
MKKIISFVLVMMLSLSMLSVSFADSKNDDEKEENFKEIDRDLERYLKDNYRSLYDVYRDGGFNVYDEEVDLDDDESMDIEAIVADEHSIVVLATLKGDKRTDFFDLVRDIDIDVKNSERHDRDEERKVFSRNDFVLDKGEKVGVIYTFFRELELDKDEDDSVIKLKVEYKNNDVEEDVELPFKRSDIKETFFDEKVDIEIKTDDVDADVKDMFASKLGVLMVLDNDLDKGDDELDSDETFFYKQEEDDDNELKLIGYYNVDMDDDEESRTYLLYAPIAEKESKGVFVAGGKVYSINMKDGEVEETRGNFDLDDDHALEVELKADVRNDGIESLKIYIVDENGESVEMRIRYDEDDHELRIEPRDEEDDEEYEIYIEKELE